ncbi:MAG: AAA family ATPase [Marinobacter sp.]|uniref:AAA family ATPase n=1 Tax=Marinobacter sp. TaxID=50741 RepID=UPI00299CF85F|nr:AAA family ATPase [Marinobacter sp.]MDX1633157.1 AAA family ATPase [Marinobacter sp.]
MYYDFFGFREPPFSIAPDPRYLYLSERHKEALAHLMYGIQGQGGFIVITGEVGTGKTTVSRCFIENVPAHVDIALILNPKLSARELLSSICDELGIRHPAGSSIKRLIDLINADLLAAHAAGRHKVLMIDEAQNLSAEVLEQLRLLTNLETAEKKLLQIVLLGQPELQDILARPELRQLAQRVTARYHLDAIERSELPAYLRYRLSVAGQRADLFSPNAVRSLHRLSGGVPRLINLISDRALLGAYAAGEHRVEARHIRTAAKEVRGPFGGGKRPALTPFQRYASLAASVLVAIVLTWSWLEHSPLKVDAGTLDVPLSGEVERAAAPTAAPEPTPSPVPVAEPEPLPTPPTVTAEVALTQPAISPENPFDALPAFDPASSALNSGDAYRALFAAWGLDYSAARQPIACDFADQQGLRCLHRQGSWRSMERLNRPAILELRELSGENRHVTLLGVDGEIVTLATAAGERQVRKDDIERFWLGDYSILWRLPPYLAPGSGSGASDTEAVWLSAQLMQAIGLHARDPEERSRVEALSLADQVRWYQERKGLTVDGIAGAMTLIQLNDDLNPGVPDLLSRGGQN